MLGAGANVTISSGSIQTNSVSLDDPSAVLTIGTGASLSASGGVTLAAGELHLDPNSTLANTTLRLSGGSLRGDGTLDNVTLVGTLTTNYSDAAYFDLNIAGTVALAGNGGTPNIALYGASLATKSVPTTLDGGIVLAGSTDALHPNIIGDYGGSGATLTLGPDLTLDVTGPTDLVGAASGSASARDANAINVASGGNLFVNTALTINGVVHIASGTFDLSGALNSVGSAIRWKC